MKCPKCHFDNPADTRFCGNCGTQLPSSEEIPVSRTKTLQMPLKELARGSTFAKRYEVIEELGRGGMGKVYKVFDKEVKEKLALKLLKAEIAADENTIERFRNELKFARKISHRNVCRMYDLSKEEGTHYITMEYVLGEDLKSFIRRSGQLSIGKAISIARQVCEGLAEAHRLGVVHRDLKPQNIMIDREGNARIMDFGISRSLEAKGITEAGVIIGTPEYMSPEQVEGKKADLRSDIYSMGIILYEMLTGRVPFSGNTPLSIAVKHKTEAPPDPKQVNAEIPEDLSRLILRCMEKDKGKRYQGAKEVLSDLGKIGKPEVEIISAPEWKNSIAVLPFADLSPQKDQEYFCDGMAEELINALSKVKELRVVARTSAFSFKGKEIDIREIGKKLNVETVLEGSVRKAGNRLRITAQLVNVTDGYHLWSERFDRQMEDVFAIQDEISLAIVDKLKLKLMGREKAAIVRRYTDNLEAYNLYLQGRFYCNKLTPEGAEKGIECFEAAIERDPTYALAYAGLAYLIGTRAVWGSIPPNKAFPIVVRKYAEKALEIDDTVAEAHLVLASICFLYDWNWVCAEQEFKIALHIGPTIAQTHVDYSLFLLTHKRDKEAVVEARLAQKFDPLSTMINGWVGHVLFLAGQYEEAIEQLNKVLTMDPSYWNSHLMMSFVYRERAMLQEAMVEAEKAMDFSGSAPVAVMNLASVCYLLGKKAKAEKLLDSLKERAQSEYIPPMFFFWTHLARGEVDEAYKWLEKAYENHDIWLCCYRLVPSMPPRDPGFTALLKKIGLE